MRITIEKAAELLNAGEVVAVPTETVYGLAASLKYPQAISQVFSLKGRPSNNPLIVHLSSSADLSRYAHNFPPHTFELTKIFWPGPLTLVLPAIIEIIPETVRARLPTAAFRVPSHPMAQKLLSLTGPLVMPSANLSGSPSATDPMHVEADFGVDFPVVDGGSCTQGVESTILCWQAGKWVIARLGALAPESFFSVLGYCPQVVDTKQGAKSPICPGQLYRHYAPKAHLILTKRTPDNCQGVLIGFSDRHYPGGCRLLSLGDSQIPEQAAERLYAVLRQLDQEGIAEAWVDVDLPDEGLWLTLKERLSKAALDF